MVSCPDCHAEMSYDPKFKKFVCKHCGLTLTYQEYMELRDKNRSDDESDADKKKRKHDEYLKWWLTKKE